MTKSGSFKRVVRNRAKASGKPYTQVLAEVGGDGTTPPAYSARKWRNEGLQGLLESTYGTRVEGLVLLSRRRPQVAEVFRVDRSDGPPWVARVFRHDSAHVPALAGDGRILDLLEAHDFPAERVVDDGLAVFDGPRVLLTTFVEGHPNGAGPAALADFVGRLHALPVTKTDVGRGGGAFGHDSAAAHEGRPARDIDAASRFLDEAESKVASSGVTLYESLRDGLATADGCEGLPEALTTPNVSGGDVLLQADGMCAGVDWKPAGWGPRLPAVALLLHAALGKTHPTAAPATTIRMDVIEAVVAGYRRHINLMAAELHRLAGAMRMYSMYFACRHYSNSISSGTQPTGSEGWLPRHDLTDAIAAAAVARFSA